MSITCAACKQPKSGKTDFPRSFRANGPRVCNVCRAAAAEAKRLLEAEDGRMCSRCKTAKPKTDFKRNSKAYLSCYCRDCDNERWRERDRAIKGAVTHFVCKICNALKPRDAFSTSGPYRHDHRCKECNAKRAAMGRFSNTSKYSGAKAVARRRGLDFDLTFEQFVALRSEPCRYCGHALPENGGLDRKDSGAGYLFSNVVPCCVECNVAKGAAFTHDEMLVIGKAIGAVKATWDEERHGRKYIGRPPKYPSDAEIVHAAARLETPNLNTATG